MPTLHTVSPTQVVGKLLSALDVPDLLCHVLDARAVNRVPPAASSLDHELGGMSRSNSEACIITLTSQAVRDTIISKKRAKRDLKQDEVLGNGSGRNVYVNEFLPKSVYDLLQETKRRAKAAKFKFVWMRGECVYARRAEGTPAINIKSEADLVNLI